MVTTCLGRVSVFWELNTAHTSTPDSGRYFYDLLTFECPIWERCLDKPDVEKGNSTYHLLSFSAHRVDQWHLQSCVECLTIYDNCNGGRANVDHHGTLIEDIE